MAKRLLTPDYINIFSEAFKLPEIDWYNYYLNIIEENYNCNNDITTKLLTILNNWLKRHFELTHGKRIRTLKEDGSYETFYENQTWSIDEEGNEIADDLNEDSSPYPPELRLIGSVNKDYFERHSDKIKEIQELIELKNQIVVFENQQPEIIRKPLKSIPFPEGFELSDIKERIEFITKLPELSKMATEAIKEIQENYNNKNLKTTFKANFTTLQLVELCKAVNEINLFTNAINTDILQTIFDCSIKEPLQTKNNRLLAYFFSVLDDNNLISKDWQSIIEKNNLFKSIKGKFIKAGDLATAKSQINHFGNPKGFDFIDNSIKAIKNIKS